jgi:hypothetical protein
LLGLALVVVGAAGAGGWLAWRSRQPIVFECSAEVRELVFLPSGKLVAILFSSEIDELSPETHARRRVLLDLHGRAPHRLVATARGEIPINLRDKITLVSIEAVARTRTLSDPPAGGTPIAAKGSLVAFQAEATPWGAVRIWDTDGEPRPIAHLPTTTIAEELSFAVGDRIFVRSRGYERLTLWDWRKGVRVATDFGENVDAAVASPTMELVAVKIGGSPTVDLLGFDGAPRAKLPLAEPDFVWHASATAIDWFHAAEIAFSPDGQRLAIVWEHAKQEGAGAELHRWLEVWDVAVAERSTTVDFGAGAGYGLTFSFDGRFLAAGHGRSVFIHRVR